MLKKLLNPFNIKLTETKPAFVYMGMYTALALHVAFYVTIFHFIHKFW